MCLVHSFICLGAIFCACVLLGMHTRSRKGNELIMQNNLLEEDQRSQTPRAFWIQQCLLKFVKKFQGGKNVPPLLTTLVMNYVVSPMN